MISPSVIIREVEQFFLLPNGRILKYDRKLTTAQARAIAMYLCRYFNEYSYFELAEIFDRDHSTVVHNCKKIVKFIKNSPDSRTSCAIITLTDKLKGLI